MAAWAKAVDPGKAEQSPAQERTLFGALAAQVEARLEGLCGAAGGGGVAAA